MKKIYPLSDHYDGKRFHNLTLNQPSEHHFLKWFFTRNPSKWPSWIDSPKGPYPPSHVAEDHVRVTFINHSTLLIQTQEINILTDPIWSLRASPVQWGGPRRIRNPGIELEMLPPINIILLSHNHYDHLDKNTLQWLHLHFNPMVYTGLGVGKILTSFGIQRVEEMDWWDEIKVNSLMSLTFTPTRHFSSRTPWDRNKTLWGSFVIQNRNRKIYFGSDSGYDSHYRLINQKFGPMDIALLPIGAYAPRWFMRPHHLNPVEAVQVHLELQSKVSIAIHYGTFKLSQEPFHEPEELLKKELEEKQIPNDSYILLDCGQFFEQ